MTEINVLLKNLRLQVVLRIHFLSALEFSLKIRNITNLKHHILKSTLLKEPYIFTIFLAVINHRNKIHSSITSKKF